MQHIIYSNLCIFTLTEFFFVCGAHNMCKNFGILRL